MRSRPPLPPRLASSLVCTVGTATQKIPLLSGQFILLLIYANRLLVLSKLQDPPPELPLELARCPRDIVPIRTGAPGSR